MNLDLLDRYGWRMLEGLGVTLQLVTLSLLLGFLIAVPLALARLGRNRAIAAAAFGYSYFFRGTPLLAQVFLAYYGAGQFRTELEAVGLWGFFREAYNCALLAFSLNTAAYQAEVLRGAIRAVPGGQIEAALALGLRRFAIARTIVAPQAALIALRPYGNEVILMIKGSAVASIVTIFDLMGTTRLAFARSFDFEVYLWAAVLYLAMVETVRRAWDAMEWRMTRHLRSGRGMPNPVGEVRGVPDVLPART